MLERFKTRSTRQKAAIDSWELTRQFTTIGDLYRDGQAQEARSLLRELLEHHEAGCVSHYIASTCYVLLGDIPEATAAAAVAVTLDPTNPTAYTILARLLRTQGN